MFRRGSSECAAQGTQGAGDDRAPRPEVYLYYPNGVGRSKLTNAFLENRLDVAGTARNWNTLKKLVEIGATLERA
jgi:uncharacterized protein (DUF1697 family)